MLLFQYNFVKFLLSFHLTCIKQLIIILLVGFEEQMNSEKWVFSIVLLFLLAVKV